MTLLRLRLLLRATLCRLTAGCSSGCCSSPFCLRHAMIAAPAWEDQGGGEMNSHSRRAGSNRNSRRDWSRILWALGRAHLQAREQPESSSVRVRGAHSLGKSDRGGAPRNKSFSSRSRKRCLSGSCTARQRRLLWTFSASFVSWLDLPPIWFFVGMSK